MRGTKSGRAASAAAPTSTRKRKLGDMSIACNTSEAASCLSGSLAARFKRAELSSAVTGRR